jgi:dTDP-4-dehydrorhamnose 3,5-epimerase
MKVLDTPLVGLQLVQTTTTHDPRGAFSRLFCARELHVLLGHRQIAQINQSRTTMVGAVRGLHFQHPPHAEMKMVRCLAGRIWDIAVDLRAGSPTFLQWYAEELTSDNGQMMVIPEGFAHGFQVLEPDSELLYLHTEFYHPSAEAGLRHDDPRLGIPWPLATEDLSVRDRSHPLLGDDFVGIAI